MTAIHGGHAFPPFLSFKRGAYSFTKILKFKVDILAIFPYFSIVWNNGKFSTSQSGCGIWGIPRRRDQLDSWGTKNKFWGVFPWGCSRLILLYQGWQVRVKTRARSMYMYVASNFGGGTKRSVPTTFSCRGRCKRSGSIPVDRKRFPGSAGVISFRVFLK